VKIAWDSVCCLVCYTGNTTAMHVTWRGVELTPNHVPSRLTTCVPQSLVHCML